MKKRLMPNQGFILAEVTLAIFIISVALIPISGMLIQAIQSNTMAREYTIVANLAQKQLELLKIHSPTYWAGLSLPYNIPWQDEMKEPGDKYKFTTKAVSVNANLVKVTVTALWQERGTDCRVEFMTLYPTL
ncbi:type II secretion system protein J [Pelosinus sp. sgz500959]|uniref:PulJ/GspJ family protein n=1 Tax=Pelosinus sp. sgz500959 TaxID=3242472 RepID=UPI00366E657E